MAVDDQHHVAAGVFGCRYSGRRSKAVWDCASSRTRGCSAAIFCTRSAVSSVDSPSTTRISHFSGSYSWSKSCRSVDSMCRPSFRTGTITLIDGFRSTGGFEGAGVGEALGAHKFTLVATSVMLQGQSSGSSQCGGAFPAAGIALVGEATILCCSASTSRIGPKRKVVKQPIELYPRCDADCGNAGTAT